MSQEQYNALLSNLLKEKCALAKLREELEGRKGRLCKCYKGFGHLARNYRKLKEGVEGIVVPQNKFEVLRSRMMQCGAKERIVRNVRRVIVRCFKYGEEGHKCRECPLWVKKERAARVASPRKAQQERRPARPVRKKAQEGGRRLRRMEEEKAARSVKGEAQQE